MADFIEKLQRIVDPPGPGSVPFTPQNEALNTGEMFNFRDNFLRLMQNWEFGIPNQTLWLAYINPYPIGLNARDFLVYEGTDGSKKPNNISGDLSKLTSKQYQHTQAGCVFINGVQIPAETLDYDHVNLPRGSGRGFIPGIVSQNRAAFNPVTTRIIESNLSFTHSIIRPWLILASHYGLVARHAKDVKNIKTNLQIIQLAKTTANSPALSRKIFRFYNCVPVSYTPSNLPYNTTDLETFEIQWIYSHYNIETLPDKDIDVVIKEVEKYPAMKAIDKITDGKAREFVDKASKIAGEVIDGLDMIDKVKRTAESLGIL
jgi:hypothetical protein